MNAFEGSTEIDGGVGGTAQLSITGPLAANGSTYALASVTYCVEPFSPTGFVDEASIIGLDHASFSVEVKDTTNRTTDGCYTVAASAEVRSKRNHHLMLYVQGTVAIHEVTATWTVSS